MNNKRNCFLSREAFKSCLHRIAAEYVVQIDLNLRGFERGDYTFDSYSATNRKTTLALTGQVDNATRLAVGYEDLRDCGFNGMDFQDRVIAFLHRYAINSRDVTVYCLTVDDFAAWVFGIADSE